MRVRVRVLRWCGLLVLAVTMAATAAIVAPSRAWMAGWEPTGLAERTLSLQAPTSGAFFATTEAATLRSDDGGQSWTDLGLAEQKVNDLALGVEGASLYAATDKGVFRMPLR
jgi:hypothetical protein